VKGYFFLVRLRAAVMAVIAAAETSSTASRVLGFMVFSMDGQERPAEVEGEF